MAMIADDSSSVVDVCLRLAKPSAPLGHISEARRFCEVGKAIVDAIR